MKLKIACEDCGKFVKSIVKVDGRLLCWKCAKVRMDHESVKAEEVRSGSK